jgi:hypothetical protein
LKKKLGQAGAVRTASLKKRGRQSRRPLTSDGALKSIESLANRNGAKMEPWSRSVFTKPIRLGAIAFDIDQNPWFHWGRSI